MKSFPTAGSIAINQLELHWNILHWGGCSNAYENHRGLAVKIVLVPNKTKELILEFPFDCYFFGPPKSKQEFLENLSCGIELALNNGWIPEKRGNPFRMKLSNDDLRKSEGGSMKDSEMPN